MLRDSRVILRRLKTEGFELISVRGSHHKFWHPSFRTVVIVPHPKSDLPMGTVASIYKQAGWKKD